MGQLVRSSAVKDILDPLMKIGAPPKEFKTLVKWLDSQADTLATSRVMFAGWPSRPKLPTVLFAIEFDSPEEARKFEPRLKLLLPKLFADPQGRETPHTANDPHTPTAETPPATNVTAKPTQQYFLMQTGSLALISDVPFTLKALRPAGSKLLADDQNLRRVRDRFTTEALFVYFDFNSIAKEEEEQRRKYEEEARQRREAEAANPPKPVPEPSAEIVTEMQADDVDPPAVADDAPAILPEVSTQTGSRVVVANPVDKSAGVLFGLLSQGFLSGASVLPEALGLAISFDSDSYSVRALLLSGPDGKGPPLPFLPQLVSGPALVPESPSVLPADTEFFVALSVDYPLIYDGLLNAINHASEMYAGPMRPAIKEVPSDSPFAAYEKSLGIKIKDDLLPLLGNEIALSLPNKTLDVGPPPSSAPASSDVAPSAGSEPGVGEKPSEPATPSPVIAIAIRDKEGVRKLIPKLIESIGLKGASLIAQTEKRDDTELVSYAGAFSYAFIGNFLVMSPDTKSVRHVVDSYLANETLGANSHFRNSTRWQPRQLLGQVYVSPALMESYSSFARNLDSPFPSVLTELLSQLSPTAEPVTYSLSNEGMGPLHELHVPKNLLLLMIAGISGATEQSGPAMNEVVAQSSLRTIVSAEATYKATTGNGKYGTFDEMVSQGLLAKDIMEKKGYRLELNLVGSSYEARANPLEYGKTGKVSFFIDESGVLRGGDHGGGPATVSDKPVQ